MPAVWRGFLRLLLGTVVFGSGVGKALDLQGFTTVLDTYRAFPAAVQPVVAIAVTLLELGLGAWILSGVRLRTAAANWRGSPSSIMS